ncbi:MAG: hypothetical protein IT355_18925 [Gemmatimonadaceae bacterium]|nr:hypothetical protein [Gemmatimonadaceae bacterium]
MTTPRSTLMAVLTVVAVLCVGIVAGIGLDRSLLHRRADVRGSGGGGGGGGRRGGGGPFGIMDAPPDTASRNRMRARIVRRIADDLTLTPAQVKSVDSIFVVRERQLDTLRARVGPQLDSLRDQMRASIDSVLTPAQREKFATSRQRMEQRRRGGGDEPSREDGGGR